MWVVKFRCEKGHEQIIKMPEETGEKGARLFAAMTGGGELSKLIAGARDIPPSLCAWSDAGAKQVLGGSPCGAEVRSEVSHVPGLVSRGTRQVKPKPGSIEPK
jgi:hypothetical protein